MLMIDDVKYCCFKVPKRTPKSPLSQPNMGKLGKSGNEESVSPKKVGNCENEESEPEYNNHLLLGMDEAVQLCHHCANYPCLCLLLKVEMKIEALREGRKNENEGKN